MADYSAFPSLDVQTPQAPNLLQMGSQVVGLRSQINQNQLFSSQQMQNKLLTQNTNPDGSINIPAYQAAIASTPGAQMGAQDAFSAAQAQNSAATAQSGQALLQTVTRLQSGADMLEVLKRQSGPAGVPQQAAQDAVLNALNQKLLTPSLAVSLHQQFGSDPVKNAQIIDQLEAGVHQDIAGLMPHVQAMAGPGGVVFQDVNPVTNPGAVGSSVTPGAAPTTQVWDPATNSYKFIGNADPPIVMQGPGGGQPAPAPSMPAPPAPAGPGAPPGFGLQPGALGGGSYPSTSLAHPGNNGPYPSSEAPPAGPGEYPGVSVGSKPAAPPLQVPPANVSAPAPTPAGPAGALSPAIPAPAMPPSDPLAGAQAAPPIGTSDLLTALAKGGADQITTAATVQPMLSSAQSILTNLKSVSGDFSGGALAPDLMKLASGASSLGINVDGSGLASYQIFGKLVNQLANSAATGGAVDPASDARLEENGVVFQFPFMNKPEQAKIYQSMAPDERDALLASANKAIAAGYFTKQAFMNGDQ